MQRRATKLVPGLYDMPYDELLRTLNLPTLTYHRLHGDMIDVFKLLHPEYGYKTLALLLIFNDKTSRVRAVPFKKLEGDVLPQLFKLHLHRISVFPAAPPP